MNSTIIEDIVRRTLHKINSDLGTQGAIHSSKPSAVFDIPGNRVNVQTGFCITGYYYVSVNHPLQVQGLSEAIYNQTMDLINKHHSTVHPAPNGHPHEIYFPVVAREVFNIDCKYHKTGLFAIVTYTNKATNESVIKHYTYTTNDKSWVLSSSSELRAFREMRGEITESVSKIKSQFFTPDDKGSDAVPRVENDGTVSIPNSRHCHSLILNVEVSSTGDEELNIEVEKVALVNGSSQFVWHKFNYRVWLTKAGKVMIHKKKHEGDWWGLSVYNLADFEQHPLNGHYHHLLTEGQPTYQTNSIWVTKNKKVFAKVAGSWLGLNPQLFNHFDKMLPSDIYAEYLIYHNFSKSL